jgi:uncharacterized protein
MNAKTPDAPGDPARTRLSLALFLGLIPALVAVPLWLRIVAGGPRHPRIESACLFALVWVPAVASVIARLCFREGFRDVSLRLPKDHAARIWGFAILIPIAVAVTAYVASWRLGLAPFSPPVLPTPWPAPADGMPRMALALIVHLATGFATWAVLALGEEIGWRGFLLPRLMGARLPAPVLLSGIVWSAWHVPIVLWGGYPAGPNRWVSAAIIVVTLTSFAFVLARLRLESGSVWPAVVAHAVWNSAIFDTLDRATPATTMWTRETGVLVALASVLAAALCWHGRWPRRMAPGDPPL